MSIKVEPSSIDFGSIEPGNLYVMTFSVRNVGTSAQRIRLQAPKSSMFALNYIPAGIIAPGLDLRAEVECLIPKEINGYQFIDTLVVSLGSEKVEVAITASKPHLRLHYSPSVNLGFVQINQHVSKEIDMENISNVPGFIKFSPARSSNLKLLQTKLDFQPCGNKGSKSALKISFEGKDVGIFREYIYFQNSTTNDEETIEIIAQIVAPQLSVVGKDGALSAANFGSIFFGESRSMNALLVNNGPQPLSFSVRFDEEEENANPQSETSDQGAKQLSVFPTDGIIKPYSELSLVFNFAPLLNRPQFGFEQNFRKETKEPFVIRRLAVIECLDSSQSIPISVEGIAVAPMITVTPSLLRFGDCPVNDRRDILVTLKNRSELPFFFDFPLIANFKFSPLSGKILPNESVSIVASFLPPQLGTFKCSAPLIIQKGLKTFNLKMVGEAYSSSQSKTLIGGTDKLPQDFSANHKFVNPEEEATARQEKKNRLASKTSTENNFNVPPIIAASSESDEIYGTDVLQKADVDPRASFMHQMQTFYKNHNSVYNDYLTKSAEQRSAMTSLRKKMKLLRDGAVDFTDPFGVNLGMERGLEEPLLKLPPALEGLILSGGSTKGSTDGSTKGRLPVDENRLIQKKYPAEPSTQAQFRDCTAELSQEELKLVTASHKVIDFGRICVGSVSYKNFVVFNSLKKAVRVAIEDLEVEIQQSKPASQVIPEGGLAGFDICLTSRAIGKLKRSFTWKINGNQSFKVHLVAEIVPIEIIMSRKELEFSFPEDYIKQTLTTDIVLTNPGNAYADFLWGSAGAFSCEPEKGSIAPSKSTVIAITWDPHASKRVEEDIGLHVTGGVDQVLKVRGHLLETHAEFSDKRIQLGVMAVGSEKEIISSVINTGENSLVFFLNPIDSQLGIRVDPSEAKVSRGESVELKIIVTPKVARSYDNVSISAKVRGGKNISIRLNGSSIIPEVEISPSTFRFGNVTVDGVSRVPFSITNRSSITASLMLDLSSFPDYAPGLLNPLEKLDLATKEFGPLPIAQEDEIGNHIILLQQKSKLFDEKSKKNTKKKQSSYCWKLIIAANSTLNGELVFRPTTAKKYSFKLPLQLLGVIDDKTLLADVTALGIASALTASSYVVDFGDRVVSRDPLSRVSYFQETTITNVSQSGVSFTLQEGVEEKHGFESTITDHQSSGMNEPTQIFFVSPLKIDLAPGASTKVRVTFQPQESANYTKKLGIFLKDQEDSTKAYLTLLCVGSGVYPCLSFNREYLQLPSVPLGVTSKAAFTIFNYGYASLEIKHRVSPNIPVVLEVNYPDGNQVGIMTEKIRVIVSYKSEQSVAWSGKIEFYDMDGERFFISVCGMTDNSLFSNYWFVKNYSSDYGFIGLDDAPVQFLPASQIQELRQIEAKRKEEMRKLRSLERQKAVEGKIGGSSSVSDQSTKRKDEGSIDRLANKLRKETMVASAKAASSSAEGVDVDRTVSNLLEEAEGKFLLKWLNRNICRRMFDSDNFPLSLIDNQAELVVETLELMSGKKVNLVSQKASVLRANDMKQEDQKRVTEKSKQIASADKALFRYQQIINFLLSNGALLNHINVIWLLSQEEYLLMLEYELTRDKSQRITPAILSNKRRQWNEEWTELCRRSWLEVLYQAIKVFVLSRITFKELSSLPGIVLSAKNLNQPSNNSASKGKGGDKAKKVDVVIPKDMVASNVFTHNEQVLLHWLSYHLERAEGLRDEGAQNSGSSLLSAPSLSFNKRVTDLKAAVTDFYPFCQLFHSHISDITKKGEPLHGYTSFDRSRMEEMFARFEESSTQYHVEIPSLTPEEVLQSTRNILLLLIHMYLNLPHLIPKTKIEFVGMVGTAISKRIELKNPSKKPLGYAISLKGSEDFTAEGEEITIPPESAIEFQVTLNARFTQQVESKIFFWNRREANLASGPSLSFHCLSQIKGIQPFEKIFKAINLFEFESIGVPIKNPYRRDIVAKVKIEVKFSPRGVEEYLPAIKAKKKQNETFRDIPLIKPRDDVDFGEALLENQNEKNSASNDDWDLDNMFRQPFWVNEETISIPKGAQKILNLSVLPFQLGVYICQVVIMEPDLGEFSYEVTVDVILPKSGERLSLDVAHGAVSKLSLSFNSKNVQFERALSSLTEARIKNANKKIRARAVITNHLSSFVTSEEFGCSTFLLDFSNPLFAFNRKFYLVSEYLKWAKSTENSKANSGSGVTVKLKKQQRNMIELHQAVSDATESLESLLNRSIITFSAEKAGVYRTIAVIRPEDNPFDIRCVELVITAKIPDVKMALEFKGPARTRITQEIPIHNETTSDWSLSVVSTGRNFTAPKILNVCSKHTTALEVSFYSLVVGKFEGRLQLKNPETNDMFEYQLIGIAEDSLAEDTLHFQCSARKKATFTIAIPALESLFGSGLKPPHGEDKSFRVLQVDSDLAFTTLKDSIKIPADGGNYDFSVNCPMGGELTGFISFKDAETQLEFWYAVSIDVNSPQEEKTVEVEAVVRQAAVIEITLDNPLNEDLTFEVSFQGDGLIGEKSLTLLPKNSFDAQNSYELIYSPLFAGTTVGKVSFWNELVGEVWYKLVLKALPAPAVEVPTIESMIGAESSGYAVIENPLNEPMAFSIHVEDTEHFSVLNQKISIKSFEQARFEIKFRPTSFQDICYSQIKLRNKKLGEIVYNISGKGILPGVMPVTVIEGPLQEIVSENMLFRNPFPHPLPIEMILIPDTTTVDNVFSVLLRRTNDIVVPAKSPYHIPVSFSPKVLGSFNATLQIRTFVSGHKLLWCYPIQGLAEVGAVIRLPTMRTMSKTSLIKEHVILLSGLKAGKSVDGLSLSDFTISFKVDEELNKLVNRSFKFQPLEVITSRHEENSEIGIRARLLFEPLRMFSGKVEISIILKSLGKWKASIELDAISPEPDDIIKLIAKVGDTDRVSFKLNNRFLGYSPFQAYFSSSSSPHFSVEPTNGLLAPYDAEGTSFVVTFSPQEYGYIESGILNILTEDTQWTYQVKGSYPDLSVHSSLVKSKINSKR